MGQQTQQVQQAQHTQQALKTEKAAPPRGPYSQGIAWERLIFTASVGTANPALGTPPEGDVRAATRGALENVKQIVEAGGGSLATVLRVTCYLRDLADYDAVNEVYREFFNGPILPARSMVPVTGARQPVAFDAIAYRT